MANKSFETCKARIRMMERGTENLLNTVDKDKVTPPEFLLLEFIHGRANVQFLEIKTDKKGEPIPAAEQIGFDGKGRPQYRERNHQEEFDRLVQWYGQNSMAEVYQGKEPRLHFTFEAAGINTDLKDNVTNLSESADPAAAAHAVAEALKNKNQGGA